jgi:hypothetical protein
LPRKVKEKKIGTYERNKWGFYYETRKENSTPIPHYKREQESVNTLYTFAIII